MSHEELLDEVRKVHSGSRYFPAPVMETLANRDPESNLSPRELEILRLIVNGLSNKEISEKSNVTVGTVKWHVNTILARLHVVNRTQAAVAALDRGIVDCS